MKGNLFFKALLKLVSTYLYKLYFQDVVVSQPTATDQAPESGVDEKVGAAAAGGSGERSPLKESTPPPSYSTLVMEDEK